MTVPKLISRVEHMLILNDSSSGIGLNLQRTIEISFKRYKNLEKIQFLYSKALKKRPKFQHLEDTENRMLPWSKSNPRGQSAGILLC